MYSYVVVVALARNIVGRMLSTRPTTLADNISSRFCQMLASQLGLFEMHGVALEYGEIAGSSRRGVRPVDVTRGCNLHPNDYLCC